MAEAGPSGLTPKEKLENFELGELTMYDTGTFYGFSAFPDPEFCQKPHRPLSCPGKSHTLYDTHDMTRQDLYLHMVALSYAWGLYL